MSKGMIWGLLLLAVFILILIKTPPGNVTVSLLFTKTTLRTSYALLGAAGIGVVVGVLLRK